MPWKKRIGPLAIRVALLLAVFFACDATIKGVIKWKVSDIDPALSVGRVEWSLSSVTLRQVRVQKSWISGTIEKVLVEVELTRAGFVPSAIDVVGGSLTFNLDKKPGGDPEAKKPLRLPPIRSIRLDEIRGVQGSYVGWGKRVTADLDRMCCVEAGVVMDPGLSYALFVKGNRLDVKGVCLDRIKKVLTVEEVKTTILPPKHLPGVGKEHEVLALKASLDLKSKVIRTQDLKITDLLEAKDAQISYVENLLNFHASTVQTMHPWLSPGSSKKEDLTTFTDVGFQIPLSMSGSVQFSSKNTQVSVDLTDWKISGQETCSDWASALPHPKPNVLDDPAFFKGNFGFDVNVGSSTAVKLRYDCKAMCSNPVLASLNGKFSYDAYKADGSTLFTRETGPGSKDWVPLAAMPTHLPETLIALEDPSFYQHRGLLTASIKVALEETLDRRSFFRGGSTLPQQLAKNLWLTRDKTVTRKAVEALMALALESCFTKEQILEIYLNVVEFAPDVYGIGPGAQHYFRKHPSELNPEEAYYLIHLLPHPKSALPPEQGGLAWARINLAKLTEKGILPEDFLSVDPSLDTSGWVTME